MKDVPWAYSYWKQRRIARRFCNEKTNGLAEAIATIVPIEESIIDLGASIGREIRALRGMGYRVYGIDATLGIDVLTEGLVECHDLMGSCSAYFRCADWALFMEVGEHVPPELEDKLIDEVSKIPRRGLIVSWARPGYNRSDHVNLRDEEHVVKQFEKRKMCFDKNLTCIIRQEYKRRRRFLLVFRRKN